MSVTGLDAVSVVHPDGTTALRSVTVLAEGDELVVVLGPSGSGKSTLLRTVAGLVSPSAGTVLIAGRRVNGSPVRDRNVAMVFEESNLMPFLTVEQNLGLGLRARRVPGTEAAERIRSEALGLRLGRLLPRRARTLSPGEQGLTGIGRALVRVPAVFLFDEPLGHLDAAERVRVRRRIVEVVKGVGAPALYVTHDQEEAMAIADRVVLLQDGAVVQADPPRELYRRPVNLFAAGFVGAPPIGLLPAVPVVSAGLAGYRAGSHVLATWAPLPDELGPVLDRPVVLGLRAEQVKDAAAGYDPDLARVPGVVLGIENTGRDVVVIAEVDAPPVHAPGADTWELGATRAVLRSRFDRDSSVRPGDTVELAVDVARAHVFDATTGKALLHPPD